MDADVFIEYDEIKVSRGSRLRNEECTLYFAGPGMCSNARLRSAGGVYLSGGLKPATETSRILTYPPLIEAGVFPTEIKPNV